MSTKAKVSVDNVEITIGHNTIKWLRRLKLALFKRRAKDANVVILGGHRGSGTSYLMEKLVPAAAILDLEAAESINEVRIDEQIPRVGPVGINEPNVLQPDTLARIVELTQHRGQQLVLRTQRAGHVTAHLLPAMNRSGLGTRFLVARVA